MVTIIGSFAFLAGIITSIAFARNISYNIKSVSYFILGLIALLLSIDFFENNTGAPKLLPYLFISVLTVHFFIGQLVKHKTKLFWSFIPIISSVIFLFLPEIENVFYLDFEVESSIEVFGVAFLAASTPIITHLIKIGIRKLVLRFTPIQWNKTEDNYLESLISYAFIGGIAALSIFLLGNLGLVISGTFYLSSAFLSYNKLSLKNGIMFSTSGALSLLIIVPLIIHLSGFENLNFLRGEVLEGAFLAGCLILLYDLFIRLAQLNSRKWKVLLVFKGIFIPILLILVLGLLYTQTERLGGILTLSALLITMSIISIIFSLFNNRSFVSLKLISVGTIILLTPYISPVEQTSNIDLKSLGIEEKESTDKEKNEPKGKDLSDAIGNWKVNEDKSKIFFELGPSDGRTKGEFKVVRGSFTIAENIDESKLKITLPVSSLTTYISPRDKELMGAGYFNEEKFPEITFESNRFEKSEDKYNLTGDFTMMGITKPLKVALKFIGKGEQNNKEVIVLSGKSKVDRTQFGMSSSSKIGNDVEFNYEIQLDSK